MAACRRLPNIAQRSKIYICRSPKYYSTGINLSSKTADANEIVVPYRIQRGPTDILKALNSTISKDFTAPQYKYEDDPYFIPISNVAKRAFALSKESGKKAARYFLQEYPELFKCNKSVPHIKAFDPPIVYTEENVSSLDSLTECIKNYELNSAVVVYDILMKKGITVTQSAKQDLLELLCFYNGIQPADEDYYEERYFQRHDELKERWNAKGMAEQLFEEMEKDSKAYSAMIAGAAKFKDSDRAMLLFEEMKNKKLTPTVEAYNGLISIIPRLQEMSEPRWEYCMKFLSDMRSDGLVPNLYTMNTLLDVVTRNKKWWKAKKIALNILAEMKRLNIEPSLGTYSFIITVFSHEGEKNIGILYEILDEIEGKEFSIRHPSDVTFFRNAMEKCSMFAKDKDLGYRIHKLLEYQSNCKLLGNALSESLYFKNFFRLLCNYEDLDKFMDIYDKYVPNTYTPEPFVMQDILQTIHLTASYKYLPKLCSDVLVFEHTEREHVLSLVMEAAGIMKHEEQTQKELVHIIWKIVEKQNTRLKSGRRFNFQWTGQLLGDALKTFINGNDLEKSWSIMEQLVNEEFDIVGYPEKESLLMFCELFLENGDYSKVTFCMKYALNGAYPGFGTDFKKLVDDMFAKKKLEATNRTQIDEIINSFSTSDTSRSDSSDATRSDSSDATHSDQKASFSDPSDASSSDSSDTSSDSSSSDEEDDK